MLSTTTVQVFSLTFDFVGQAAILVLIATFLLSKSLPQRNNPFFLNFLIVTFLTQIPPSLLFYSGDLGRDPPKWLCSTQSIFMDGVSPMCGFAWLIVVYQTWTDLRVTLIGGTSLGRKSFAVKLLLVTFPYFAFVAWTLASFAAVLLVPATWRLSGLVFCANESALGIKVRQSIGICLLGIGVLQFLIEFLIGWLIYQSRKTAPIPRTGFGFALRVLVFCIAQLVPIIFSIVNSLLYPRYIPIKQLTQMLVSMNAFATFLVFGTQRHVLKAWKFWEPDEESPPILNISDDSAMHSIV